MCCVHFKLSTLQRLQPLQSAISTVEKPRLNNINEVLSLESGPIWGPIWKHLLFVNCSAETSESFKLQADRIFCCYSSSTIIVFSEQLLVNGRRNSFYCAVNISIQDKRFTQPFCLFGFSFAWTCCISFEKYGIKPETGVYSKSYLAKNGDEKRASAGT